MKSRIAIAAIVIICSMGLFSSCNVKDLAKVSVGVPMQSISFSIPPAAAGTDSLAGMNIYVNVDSIINAANSQLGIGNIKSVTITSCHLVILNGDMSNNFANLQSCMATLSSNTNTTPVTIGQISNNPDATAYTLDIPVNTTMDLSDYFQANSFNYQFTGTVRRATTKTLNCTATIQYTLVASL